MVIFSTKRKSNWPAIAAMLIAGLVSVAPKQLNAMQGTPKPVACYPVEGEKNTKVEPDKNGNFNFTIRLFKTSDKTKIYHGSAYINNLGSFVATENGDIQIQINNQDIPEIITVAISTSGYGYHEFTIYKKDLKNSTSTDLYFDEVQMTAGIISIQEDIKPE